MKHALIVKLGAIGDVVMTIPAAHELYLRGYSIEWVAGSAAAPLLRCYSWIRVVEVDDSTLLRGSLPARLAALCAVWRATWGKQYDLIATLYYDLRWRVVALPLRARQHLTLQKKGRRYRILPGRSHSAEFARILLQLDDTCREFHVPPLRPDQLPDSPLPSSGQRRIALVPAGASNTVREQALRRWPAERYASLAAEFLRRGDEVVLLGGPGDAWVREHFRSLTGQPGLHDLIGATTLPQLISLADTCSLVVTHDTGPLHLAGLSRAPILALFGPTDPGSFLPRRAAVRVLWGGADLACRPCHDGRDFAPCTFNGCMHSLHLDAVLRIADKMLGTDAVAPMLPVR